MEEIFDKIALGFVNTKKIDLDNINFDELDVNTKKTYKDFSTGTLDYYKIIA